MLQLAAYENILDSYSMFCRLVSVPCLSIAFLTDLFNVNGLKQKNESSDLFDSLSNELSSVDLLANMFAQ